MLYRVIIYYLYFNYLYIFGQVPHLFVHPCPFNYIIFYCLFIGGSYFMLWTFMRLVLAVVWRMGVCVCLAGSMLRLSEPPIYYWGRLLSLRLTEYCRQLIVHWHVVKILSTVILRYYLLSVFNYLYIVGQIPHLVHPWPFNYMVFYCFIH